jgi:hypothetical protein
MIDPRQFYRKMDKMLARISREEADGQFLQHILDELVTSFGTELNFGNGHMYRELFGALELLHTTGVTDIFPARIPVNDPSIQHVLSHGSFVYETATEIPDWFEPGDDDSAEFVAI